jgi:hypothetical protein
MTILTEINFRFVFLHTFSLLRTGFCNWVGAGGGGGEFTQFEILARTGAVGN